MFLAQIVFSFRSPCLKAVVTDFVLPGTRGEEERGDRGLLVRGAWMRGNGQDMPSRYIFICVKWAEYLLKSICIRMLHQIIFVTLTQFNFYSKNDYNSLLILEEERFRVLSF